MKNKMKVRTILGITLITSLMPMSVMAETMDVPFPESTSQSTSKTIDLPNQAFIKGVTVDTGGVSYTQNGRRVTLNVSGGTAVSSQYNSTKYSKYISKTLTNSSNSFPYSESYSDGAGYSGTYYKNGNSYVYSGIYTPYDEKTATDSRSTSPGGSASSLPSSIPYNSGGYSGTLYGGSAVQTGGNYETYDPINAVDTRTFRCGNSYIWSDSSRSWSYGGTYDIDYIPSSISYSNNGYTGTLYRAGVIQSCSAPAPTLAGSYNGERRNSNAGYTTLNYRGTATKPPSADTRVWTVYYSGTVARPSSDTRVWAQDYSGTAYAGGYDSLYKYNVTIDYGLDTEMPDGILTASPTDWTNGNVTITLSDIKDYGESGINGVFLPNGTFVKGSSIPYVVSSNGEYSFIIEDNVGNRTTKSITIGNIDKSAPTATISQTPMNYTNGDVFVELTNITDIGVSGLKEILLPDGESVQTFEDKSFKVSENGLYTFKIRDNAGNESTRTMTVSNIDKTAPTASLTQSPNDFTNGNVVLTLDNIQDTGVSGLKRIILPNGTEVAPAITTYSVTENGVYEFIVEDNAGNQTIKTIEVKNIDKVNPTANISAEHNDFTNKNILLFLTEIEDSGVSGLQSIKLPNGTIKKTFEDISYEVDKNGLYRFEIQDNAGNITSKEYNVENIDKQQPDFDIDYSPKLLNKGPVKISLSNVRDNGVSGVKELSSNMFGVSPSQSNYQFMVNGNGMFTFTVRDHAGNVKTKTLEISNIDNEKPTAKIDWRKDWTNEDVIIELSDFKDAGTAGYSHTVFPNGVIMTGNTAIFTVRENGIYSFDVFDNVGNVNTMDVVIENIDKEKPMVEIQEKDKTNDNVKAIIKIRDINLKK